MTDLIHYLFYGIGAGVVWIFKGCRTSYWDELEKHDMRNGLMGLLIILCFLGLGFFINN